MKLRHIHVVGAIRGEPTGSARQLAGQADRGALKHAVGIETGQEGIGAGSAADYYHISIREDSYTFDFAGRKAADVGQLEGAVKEKVLGVESGHNVVLSWEAVHHHKEVATEGGTPYCGVEGGVRDARDITVEGEVREGRWATARSTGSSGSARSSGIATRYNKVKRGALNWAWWR